MQLSKKNYWTLLYLIISLSALTTVTAQDVSLQNPFRATKSTIIELEKDIVISELGTPFIAITSFGRNNPETITLHSSNGSALIVTSTGIWDLRSFNTKNKTIEFTGNARLVLKPGAQLMGNGGGLRFADNARFTIE